MKKISLNKSYWDYRYINQQTGWDLGEISPPIKKWFDKEADKELAIIIPGAGSGYEVTYGFEKGFKNIYYLDLSSEATYKFKINNPKISKSHILNCDFFDLKQNNFFDVIIEQTFFCAIKPSLREKYIDKTRSLLIDNGKIIGLLFNKKFEIESPPFGGTIDEYKILFSKEYNIISMEEEQNSVSSRKGHELWIELNKK